MTFLSQSSQLFVNSHLKTNHKVQNIHILEVIFMPFFAKKMNNINSRTCIHLKSILIFFFSVKIRIYTVSYYHFVHILPLNFQLIKNWSSLVYSQSIKTLLVIVMLIFFLMLQQVKHRSNDKTSK